MPYIGKVKLNKNWVAVEDLIKEQVTGQEEFEFGSGTYQLQAEGNLGARLCDSLEEPANDERAGFQIVGVKSAVYKKGTGTLYAKVAFEGKLTEDVLLKISNLGE